MTLYTCALESNNSFMEMCFVYKLIWPYMWIGTCFLCEKLITLDLVLLKTKDVY